MGKKKCPEKKKPCTRQRLSGDCQKCSKPQQSVRKKAGLTMDLAQAKGECQSLSHSLLHPEPPSASNILTTAGNNRHFFRLWAPASQLRGRASRWECCRKTAYPHQPQTLRLYF